VRGERIEASEQVPAAAAAAGGPAAHARPARLLDEGRVLVDHYLAGALAELGLDCLDAFMEFSGGELLARYAVGEVRRLRLRDGRGVYLKRYRYKVFPLVVKEALKGNLRLPSGMREWWTTRELELAGFPVPRSVAAGEARRRGEHRSFYASLDLAGLRPADDALRERGLPPAGVVRALARLVARLHRERYRHRDLYLCHVFVDEAWNAVLIDHHRTERLAERSRAACVKDLAALAYSAQDTPLRDVDRARFLAAYLDVESLGREGRRWWRRIAAKTARIASHDARLAARVESGRLPGRRG